MNENKTVKIYFSLRDQEVESQKPVNILGIMLDMKLLWDAHTVQIISKLSQVCYLSRKLKNNVTENMLIIASYISFLHSHLLYGNLLWGNSS